MASNTTGSNVDRLSQPLLKELDAISAAAEGLFVYSAKSYAAGELIAAVLCAGARRACTRPRSTCKTSTSRPRRF